MKIIRSKESEIFDIELEKDLLAKNRNLVDMNDIIEIEGEILLISIGQMWDRSFSVRTLCSVKPVGCVYLPVLPKFEP